MKHFTSLAAVLLATALSGLSLPAGACKPVFYQPTGFPVGYDHAGEHQRLPANARGVLYVDLRDGVPHRPSPDDFTITDVTAKRRVNATVDALTGPDRQGSYLVAPAGGFVVGHEYTFETATPPEPNSIFVPVIHVAVDTALSADDVARDARITTHKHTSQGKTFDIVGVAFTGRASAYASSIKPRVTSPRKGWPDEVIGPCGPGVDLVLTTPSGCHVVTADLDFPQLSDAPMQVRGLACMGWVTVPLP